MSSNFEYLIICMWGNRIANCRNENTLFIQFKTGFETFIFGPKDEIGEFKKENNNKTL